MFAMTSYFNVPEDTDWDGMRELARARAVMYKGLPGLRSKAFVVDPERGLYGANYLWESREHLETFLVSPLFGGIKEKLGEPELHIFEVPAYLEQGDIVFLDSAATA